MVLQKISDKGNYRIQILWNQLTSQGGNAIPSGNSIPSPTLPKQGFETEILFLNASAPLPTTKTVPQKQSGIRGETSLGGITIQITKIKSGDIPQNSVTFTARVA